MTGKSPYRYYVVREGIAGTRPGRLRWGHDRGAIFLVSGKRVNQEPLTQLESATPALRVRVSYERLSRRIRIHRHVSDLSRAVARLRAPHSSPARHRGCTTMRTTVSRVTGLIALSFSAVVSGASSTSDVAK